MSRLMWSNRLSVVHGGVSSRLKHAMSIETRVNVGSTRENEVTRPARDLFDEGPAPSLARPPVAPALRRAGSPSGLSLTRIASGLVLAGATGILLRFPGWMTLGSLCAVVIGEAFAEWPRISRVYWASLVAALCAQATSIFVTPFTWPMRFGFFFALLGAVVCFYGAQTKDLS